MSLGPSDPAARLQTGLDHEVVRLMGFWLGIGPELAGVKVDKLFRARGGVQISSSAISACSLTVNPL